MPGQLWAPWRLRYLEDETLRIKTTPSGCFLLDLPAQTQDRENLILYRGQTAFVILNRYPYANGHLMVAPYQHTANMADLTDQELLEIHQLVARCVAWLTEAFRPHGFNIGVNLGSAGGAGVPTHLHWHIVPRWEADTNFMTVVGETRVIPLSLEDTYDRLAPLAQA